LRYGTALRLPAGIKEIGEGAFYICEQLVSVTVPEGVTAPEFNGDVFMFCSALKPVSKAALREIGYTDDF
jgi:hypothetical protein